MNQATVSSHVETDDLAQEAWPPARWLLRHPRLVDSIVVALSVIPQAVALIASEGEQPWTASLVVALTGLAVLWRRRAPGLVLVAIAIIGLINPTVNQTVALAFTMYSLASQARLGRAATYFGIAAAIPVIETLIRQAVTLQTTIPWTIVNPLVLVAAVLGVAARSRRLRREAMTELLNQRIENARATERTRISAEMHDVVAHSLSVMIALANGAAAGWNKHPERALVALESLSSVGRGALLDMQRILHLLRESDGDLDEALRESSHDLAELASLVEIFRAAGLPVAFSHRGALPPDDPALRLSVHRIVQEGLTNALRYAAGARTVDLTVTSTSDSVTITLRDDGAGTGTRESLGSRRGLIGISERAAAYGGSSEAGPHPRGGWMLSATLPLTSKETLDD